MAAIADLIWRVPRIKLEPSDTSIADAPEENQSDRGQCVRRAGAARCRPRYEVELVIDLDYGLPGRRESRARVIAAGLSDEDIDRLIKEARKEVQHLIK